MSGLLWDIHAFVEAQNEEYSRASKEIEKGIGQYITDQKLGEKDDTIREFIYEKLSEGEQMFFVLGMKFGLRLMCEAMDKYLEV